jgi:hypothetical protein
MLRLRWIVSQRSEKICLPGGAVAGKTFLLDYCGRQLEASAYG